MLKLKIGVNSSPFISKYSSILTLISNEENLEGDVQIDKLIGEKNQSLIEKGELSERFEEAQEKIKQQEKEELKILKYNNTLLRRKESEMAKKLKAARDIYLRCIQSGKIKFMI